MRTIEQILEAIQAAVPSAKIEKILNPSVCAQHSLLIDHASALAVATFVRDGLKFDFLSNVTGVDWLDREITEKVKVTRTVTKTVDGVEQQVEETVEELRKQQVAGYLECVYHLFSTIERDGPLILRMRTGNRTDQVSMPSFTPIWRGCELQEREVFDLYGIQFTGHPDLRRLLMWDEFKDFPMRKDYVEPDDYEYEPTAHDEVLKRAAEHRAQLNNNATQGAAQ